MVSGGTKASVYVVWPLDSQPAPAVHGCYLSMRSGRQEATLEKTHAEGDCWGIAQAPAAAWRTETQSLLIYDRVSVSALQLDGRCLL